MNKIRLQYQVIFKLALFSAFFISVDQITKFFIIKYYPKIVSVNQGIFFGFVENPWLKYLFIISGLFLLIWLISQTELSVISHQLSAALIIAGALSNIVDRFIHGYVIDFIKLPGFLSFWPTFNLADVFIVLGVIIYLYQLFKKSKTI